MRCYQKDGDCMSNLINILSQQENLVDLNEILTTDIDYICALLFIISGITLIYGEYMDKPTLNVFNATIKRVQYFAFLMLGIKIIVKCSL